MKYQRFGKKKSDILRTIGKRAKIYKQKQTKDLRKRRRASIYMTPILRRHSSLALPRQQQQQKRR